MLSYRKFDEQKVSQMNEIIDNIYKGKIPASYPNDIINDDTLDKYILREMYTHRVSWCLISNNWLNPLYNFIEGSKCIELYAGLGLLSKELKKRGLDITPYDNMSWEMTKLGNKFTNVINKNAIDALKEYENDSLDYIIMSWVPYEDESCVKVLKYLKHHQQKAIIIWIGEDFGGCNGCEEFFENTIDVSYNKKYKDACNFINKKFQRWNAIYDKVSFLKVK